MYVKTFLFIGVIYRKVRIFYYKIKNLEEKIEGIKRVRVRYDKTKTEKYWIEELKEICREIKS